MSFEVENIMECVTVELLLNNKRNVIIGCLYRSNSRIKCGYINRILFKNVKNTKKSMYLCGDYNLDLLRN